jgi:uncharacterized damage-inducible protein DinB
MKDVLTLQYESVKGSRDVLLHYCSQISPAHFIQPIENFGHSSIRNLLVHVANSSLYWLAEYALQKPVSYGKADVLNTVNQLKPLFGTWDDLMIEFIKTFPDNSQPITGWVKWVKKDLTVTHLQLYTHVITHMFHHKGQILSMSRHLGYTPVDTDVVRF